MKIAIVIILLSFCSCKSKTDVNMVKFEINSIEKRTLYESKVVEYLNDFSDRSLRELFNSLVGDRSFISLYAITPGKVYYSSDSCKFWNHVNYQNYKESFDNGIQQVNCSLGVLSLKDNSNNETIVKNTQSFSKNIDSVLCLNYEINQVSPAVYIFFDNEQIHNKKTFSDNKLTAKSSTYTSGKYILIDSLFRSDQ